MAIDSRLTVGTGIPDDRLGHLIRLTAGGPHVDQARRDAVEDLALVDGPSPRDPRDDEALDGALGGERHAG